jgi:hypothetical protein
MSAGEDLAGGDVGPDAETLRYWPTDIKTSVLKFSVFSPYYSTFIVIL